MIEVLQELFDKFMELVIAPYTYPDMLWIVIPLLFTIIFVEFYFARYKFEELGWNTAFANSLVLIFVSFALLRYLYNSGNWGIVDFRNVLTIAVVFEGITLALISYFHLLPRKFAFGIFRGMPINLIAYVSVVLVYSDIKIDFITILCAIVLVLVLSLIVGLIKKIIPKAIELTGKELEEFREAPEPK